MQLRLFLQLQRALLIFFRSLHKEMALVLLIVENKSYRISCNTFNFLPCHATSICDFRRHMCVKKLHQILEKNSLLIIRTPLHRPTNNRKLITLGSTILNRCTSNILPGILVHTPAIPCWFVALDLFTEKTRK